MKIKDLPKHGEPGHFCRGGCAGYSKGGLVPKADHNPKTESAPPKALFPHMDGKGHRMAEDGEIEGYARGGEVKAEDSGPVEIPEDIKEFVEKAHKQIKESRPDENWRIKPGENKGSVAPYKRDEEDVRAAAEDLPGYDAGGTVDQPTVDVPDLKDFPGYDDGGNVGPALQPVDVDTDDLTPDTSSQIPNRTPVPAAAPEGIQPPILPPPAQPVQPANLAPVTNVPHGTMATPDLTDQSYMDRANKMMGLNPDQQAAFLKMLGQKSQTSQLGAGIAGIGDAIASGGTLGKVNPGNLARSEDLIQDKTKQGLEGMQTIRGNQEKAFDVAQKLEAQDPKSPLSRYAQKAYGDVGKKLGIDLSHASASLIADVAGKGVEELNTEYQGQLKQMGLQLQKEQVEATKQNQASGQANAKAERQADAAKTLAGQGIVRKVLNQMTPSGRTSQDTLVKQAEGTTAPTYTPDVMAYAQAHKITPEAAQEQKDRRTKGT